MFSYGEDNTVDFTKLNGIIGMFAPNASGKSALLDSTKFAENWVAKNSIITGTIYGLPVSSPKLYSLIWTNKLGGITLIIDCTWMWGKLPNKGDSPNSSTILTS